MRVSIFIIAILVLSRTLAAADQQPLPTAVEPLSPFLPMPRSLPTLPAPLTWADLRIDLGNGRHLIPSQTTPILALDGTWRCSGLTSSAISFPDNAQLDRGWQTSDFDDRAWDAIAVPLDWYRAYPKARNKDAPYVMGWYRRTVELGPEAQGKRAILHFGVAGYDADLWVNGHLIGSHHGDFTPWNIDISEHLVPGRNVLALRIRSDFGPKFGTAGPARHAYGSQWSISNIKGGLWQSCSLTLDTPIRITDLRISPQFSATSVRIDWRTLNHYAEVKPVTMRVIVQAAHHDREADRPADQILGEVMLAPGELSSTAIIPVPGIRAWSPDQPELYWLTVIALSNGTVISSHSQRFGFRSFTTRNGRFLLNDKPCYLFGENLKALNYGGLGESPADYVAHIERDLTGLKTNGYTIFRAAHMPVEPLVLSRADELGLMVYDEWAWCFTADLDPKEFSQRNQREVSEWILRDYNHPSVVMWSGGNEIHYSAEAVHTELDRQVSTIRALDHSGRPISTFSGAAFGYGEKPLASDVLDRHTYFGLGSAAWSGWETNSGYAKAFCDRAYGPDWSTRMPFILWETVGFSWGQLADPAFRANDPAAYLRYAKRSSTWGEPAGIGFAGSIGLTAFFDPLRGLSYGRKVYGRRIGEFIRRDPAVAGFAPWFQDTTLNEARQWTQPIFVSVFGTNGIALRHPCAGRTYDQQVMIVNDSSEALTGAGVRLSLLGNDGVERQIITQTLPPIPAAERITLPVTIPIPEVTTSGWCQLRVRVMNGDDDVSRLSYDLFVAPQSVAHSPLGPTRRIGLMHGGTDTDVRRWLDHLGITFRVIDVISDLSQIDVLVIPPACPMTADDGRTVNTWVSNGGSLLLLEQPVGYSAALSQRVMPASNTFVDLIMPAHPLFAGLTQHAFDTSDHPRGGRWVEAGLSPLTLNALACRGAFLGENDGPSAAISEGTVGTGRILVSQLLALSLWDVDSVATTYLRNLAHYVFSPTSTPATSIKPWQDAGRGQQVVSGVCRSLDLRSVANRSFTDDRDGDGAGGWTDQGSNDFRVMPLGMQTLNGVPCTIIDPATNGDRSCLVLGGAGRPDFPRQASGIAVDGLVTRLFFLHTAAWVGKQRTAAMTYRIHYMDGSTVDVPIRAGIEIGDWWSPTDLRGAALGLTLTNQQLHDIGVFLMPWENPRPDIAVTTIDVLSAGTMVPIVVAITAEIAHAKPLCFAATNEPSAWRTLVDWPGAAAQKTGVGLPIVTTSTENAPSGTRSCSIAFPESPESPDAAMKWWGAPTVFATIPDGAQAALKDPTYHYLTCWLKSDTSGSLDFVLPIGNWRDTLSATVQVEPTNGWKKIRLTLGTELRPGRTKPWTLSELRGELFIFHGRRIAHESPRPTALTIHIADPRLE